MSRHSFMLMAALTTILLRPALAAAATVEGSVTIAGRPAADAVVYLEGSAERPPRPAAQVVMDQRNLAFAPTVLPVVRGTVVEFTNSDDVQHNVFSPSAVAKKFDLGSYSRGEARRVTFDQLGEIVVLCNIHMEMEARILVLRDPYFARTQATGAYAILDVPAGSYTLKVWRKGWRPTTRTVDVPESGTLAIDVADP